MPELDLQQQALERYYTSASAVAEERALAQLPLAALRSRLSRSIEYYEDNYRPLLPTDRGGAVLDIGSGYGAFLEFMRQEGFTALEAIELSPAALACCRRLGFQNVVACEDLSAFLRERSGRYAAIHLGHVIEHFPKSAMFTYLDAIRDALAPGGCLILATPNMSHAGGLIHRYKTFGHEIGFTEWSLEQLLLRAGFAPVRVAGDRHAARGRPKRLLWLAAQKLIRVLLRAVYLAELGADRPRVLSMSLLAVAQRPKPDA